MKTHFALTHQDLNDGAVVMIDRSEKAISKIFKLKGSKLQIDDRIKAFIAASKIGDDEIETLHLKDVADFMQVKIPEPAEVISTDEAFPYLETALKPQFKLHKEVNSEN